MHTGLDGECGPVARRPRRHDQGEGRKVKGRIILKGTYVDLLDVSRAAHDLRRGGRRKSWNERGPDVVGHCLVMGQSEEWAIGGQPGAAGIGTVPMCPSERSGPLDGTWDQAITIFGEIAVVMCGKWDLRSSTWAIYSNHSSHSSRGT